MILNPKTVQLRDRLLVENNLIEVIRQRLLSPKASRVSATKTTHKQHTD